MTIKQFTKLWNEYRASLDPPRYAVKFSIEKTRIIKKRVDKYVCDEHCRPILLNTEPTVSKRVVDTGGLTKLYQAMFKYFLGTDLKRISSEGSYRPGVGFIPSSNKGIADLMGGYNGKVYYIEMKQKKEKMLPTQVKFKEWVNSFGGEYHIVTGFDDMFILIQKLLNNHV